jgi:CDP-diglyceride synthetase
MIDLVFAGRNVFILYLVLAGTFLQPLLPCHTSRFLMESMWLRHLFGFLTLMFFVAVSETELDDIAPLGTILATTAAIYFWFLLAAKMTANWWMVLAILLAALYLLELYDVRKRPEVHKNIEWAKKVILGLSMAVTLVGFVIYVGEKKLDYKSGFNYTTLLLGTTKCKGTPNVQPYLESLKAAFAEVPTRMTGGAFLEAISTRIDPIALN